MDKKRLSEIVSFLGKVREEKGILSISTRQIHMHDEAFLELFKYHNKDTKSYLDHVELSVATTSGIKIFCLVKKEIPAPSKEEKPVYIEL
jgi:hypothetical protein